MSDEKAKKAMDGVKKGVSIVGKVIKWVVLAFLIIIALVIGYSVYTCTAVTKAVVDATVDVAGGKEAIVDAVKAQQAVESGQIDLSDWSTYTKISPKELAFNIDAGSVKAGDRYVVQGKVLTLSGNTLMLADLGMLNSIELQSFAEYEYGDNVTSYIYTESVSSFGAKFKAQRIDK
jgi:hypothetical protein